MLSEFILTNLLGWKVNGVFPDVKKSIVIFAPHTSYWESVFGKLYINISGIRCKVLTKKELFFFPLTLVMKLYGAIPSGGYKNKSTVFSIAKMLEESKELHVVLSPEGTRNKVTRWNKGFYYMAKKANVPIVLILIDYKKKEIGTKDVIYNLENLDTIMQQINLNYKDVTPKYPDKFSLELDN